jgi:hypothetical protein
MTATRDERIHIRITADLKLAAKKRALDLGYGKKQGNGLTDYITDLILKDLKNK